MKPYFSYTEEKRERTGIYASDFGKLGADIILSLRNTEPSNPMGWNNYLRMSAGKGVELQMIKVLKQNGIVNKDFDQELVPTTETIVNDIPIRMKFDALGIEGGAKFKAQSLQLPQDEEIIVGEGEPIEIKSINNKNSFDINDYANSKPRDNYVGQLAIYMHTLKKDRGHLFVSSIDGLNYFWFVCNKIGEGIYKCGEVTVDLNQEFARFKKLWDIAKSTEGIPSEIWFEEKYKLPLEQIDWTKISKTKIGDARNGRYVVGTENKFKIDYSSYKDIILKNQGVTAGYSPEELEIIKTKTAGYSSKKTTENA